MADLSVIVKLQQRRDVNFVEKVVNNKFGKKIEELTWKEKEEFLKDLVLHITDECHEFLINERKVSRSHQAGFAPCLSGRADGDGRMAALAPYRIQEPVE